jgi:hypothetical protein
MPVTCLILTVTADMVTNPSVPVGNRISVTHRLTLYQLAGSGHVRCDKLSVGRPGFDLAIVPVTKSTSTSFALRHGPPETTHHR